MKDWNGPILAKHCKHPESTLTDNTTIYSLYVFKIFSNYFKLRGFTIRNMFPKTSASSQKKKKTKTKP